MKRFALKVNGRVRRVQAEPNTPLLYVLRDDLELTGPKFGCGLAQCGACSVLLDGKEIRSCVTPVSSIKDREVTTLEGLPRLWANRKHAKGARAAKNSDDEHSDLHPVQQAWIKEQVPQCGYCQNGMMIMAVDLLDKTPHPTDAQIDSAFSGNAKTGESPHLCRCGTYQSIKNAVKLASKEMA